MFPRDDGRLLHPRRVGDRFARDVQVAEVPAITPHGMRHTRATLLLAAGVHPKIVSERLGHAKVSMTLDRCSHVSMDMQAAAVERLAEALGDAADQDVTKSTGTD